MILWQKNTAYTLYALKQHTQNRQFLKYFLSSASTTKTFMSLKWRIVLLKQHVHQQQWHRHVLIYLNDIPFMYAKANCASQSIGWQAFKLILLNRLKRSLGIFLHQTFIKRSHFSYQTLTKMQFMAKFKLIFAKNVLKNQLKQHLTYTSFSSIDKIYARTSTFNNKRYGQMHTLCLEEYFFMSKDLLKLFNAFSVK